MMEMMIEGGRGGKGDEEEEGVKGDTVTLPIL